MICVGGLKELSKMPKVMLFDHIKREVFLVETNAPKAEIQGFTRQQIRNGVGPNSYTGFYGGETMGIGPAMGFVRHMKHVRDEWWRHLDPDEIVVDLKFEDGDPTVILWDDLNKRRLNWFLFRLDSTWKMNSSRTEP